MPIVKFDYNETEGGFFSVNMFNGEFEIEMTQEEIDEEFAATETYLTWQAKFAEAAGDLNAES
jgi:hypothetical protein